MDEPREGGMDRPMTRRELRALEEARRAAVQPAAEPVPAEVAAPAVEAAVEPEAAAEQPVAPQPVVERPVPAAVPAPVQRDWATTSGTTWSDDVRWSLHGELPRALPPEPADDDIPAALDVSADASAPVAAPTAPQPPQATPARGFGGAPARVSAWGGVVAATTPAQPPQSVPPPPPAPSATPVWQVVPQWNVTPETGSTPARVEEWPTEEPAGWAAADVAPDAVEPDEQPYEPTYEPTFEPTFEQADAYEVADEGVESYEQAYEQPYEQAYEQPYEEYEQPSAEAQPYGDYTQVPAPLPTLDDLIAARPGAPAGPAEQGWRGSLRRITGGLLAIRPGPAEREHREAVASLQRPLDGPRTIVVINPKGGAHKTTATLLLAATFGQHRGGYTLAWDNNETRGTLGWRAQPSTHQRTAVTLLQDLEKFADSGAARVGDLDSYVRPQGSAQFDVLASDEDAASAASIDGFAFRALHRTLSRFYRVMVVDTGNNLRASNWQAAVQAADQVVIVSTVREDTAQSAAWAVDALRAQGYEDVVRRAVTVLSDPAPKRDPLLAARLHDHFGRLTRAVVDVPYDKALVGGAPLHVDLLDRRTREAWLRVAAVVAEGL